ncbi:MAG TPA: sugar phosphate isomerase/epimerase [Armatimonadota bacterium]|nr:sugar phosphate isomerase/epimerase [Armatimonadota bacterium]
MSRNTDPGLSRRAFLKRGAAAASAGLPLLRWASKPVRAEDEGPYGPFKVGLQTYSFRNLDRAATLSAMQRLGLHYMESFAGHFPVTDDPEEQEKLKDELKAVEVEWLAAGVFGFDQDKDGARKLLEFAQAMGIPTLTAAPTPAGLKVLDELLEEFDVRIAIHNHGPGNPFDKITDVTKAMEGHHERIGACVDTGWYIASGEDPIEAIQTFGERVYAVHVKDMTAERSFTEVGKGELDVRAMFDVLGTLHYEGILALEYEEHPDDPVPYVDECLAAMREAIRPAAE